MKDYTLPEKAIAHAKLAHAWHTEIQLCRNSGDVEGMLSAAESCVSEHTEASNYGPPGWRRNQSTAANVVTSWVRAMSHRMKHAQGKE